MTTIDNKFVEEASKALNDKMNNEVSKDGYHLSYGYVFLEEGKPQIKMRPQYTAFLRHIYMFGSKSKRENVAKIIPSEFVYKDVNIPVKLEFASVGKFL